MRVLLLFCAGFLWAQQPLPPDVLMKIGDQTITIEHFLELALEQQKEETMLVLRSLLTEELLARDVQKYQIAFSEKEMDLLVRQEKELLKKRIQIDLGPEKTVEDYLKSQNLTERKFNLMTQEKVKRQLLLGKLIRYLQVLEDRVEVLYIECNSRKMAEDARRRIVSYKEPFEKVAKDVSLHTPSKNLGGRLPVLTDRDLGELAPSLFRLKPREVSEILSNNQRFHLFQIVQFYPKKELPFAQVSESLFQSLREHDILSEEIDGWLFSALERYRPELYNPLLKKYGFLKPTTISSSSKPK